MGLAAVLLLFQAAPAQAAPDPAPVEKRHGVREPGCAGAEAGPDTIVACGRRTRESPYRLPRLSEEHGRHEGVAPIVVKLADGVVLATMPVRGDLGMGAGIGIRIGF